MPKWNQRFSTRKRFLIWKREQETLKKLNVTIRAFFLVPCEDTPQKEYKKIPAFKQRTPIKQVQNFHIPKQRNITKHHLINNINGGKKSPWNLIRLCLDKHVVWHFLFQSLDTNQIISQLEKAKTISQRHIEYMKKLTLSQNKKDKKKTWSIPEVIAYVYQCTYFWNVLFGNNDIEFAISLLKRMQRMKTRQMNKIIQKNIENMCCV